MCSQHSEEKHSEDQLAADSSSQPPSVEVDSDRPIGVFDSGVGGLTVASALIQQLPKESILYLGDTARLPYGTKSSATVERYTRRNIDFLVRRGVKAVVIACNTASAVTLDHLDLPVPVWGVIEPGAREAVRLGAASCQDGKPVVAVLATESTVRSGAYVRALREACPGIEVISQPCPLFVPLVEEGWSDDPVAGQVAERYLRPLLDAGCATMVLGCTHYPMLAPVLRQVAGDGIRWVDSAQAVARFVAQRLDEKGLLRQSESPPCHHLCATDVSERFERIARELLTHYGEPQTPQEWRSRVSLEWVEV